MSSVKFPIDSSDKTLVILYKIALEEFFKSTKIPNVDESVAKIILFNYKTYIRRAHPKTRDTVTNREVVTKVKKLTLTPLEQLIVDNVGYASLIYVSTLTNIEECIQAINITYIIFDKCYGLDGIGNPACIALNLKDYIVDLILKSGKGVLNKGEVEKITEVYIRDIENDVHMHHKLNQNLNLTIDYMHTIIEKVYNIYYPKYELPMGIIAHIAAYTLYIVCLHFKLPAFSLFTQKVEDAVQDFTFDLSKIDLRDANPFKSYDKSYDNPTVSQQSSLRYGSIF